MIIGKNDYDGDFEPLLEDVKQITFDFKESVSLRFNDKDILDCYGCHTECDSINILIYNMVKEEDTNRYRLSVFVCGNGCDIRIYLGNIWTEPLDTYFYQYHEVKAYDFAKSLISNYVEDFNEDNTENWDYKFKGE